MKLKKTNIKYSAGKDPQKKLSQGLIALMLDLENKEPQNHSINKRSRNVVRVSHAWEYCADINRILQEIKMTQDFVHNLFEKKSTGIESDVENQVVYFQGILLGLIHQLKDKLLHLIDAMFSGEEYKELKSPKLEKLSEKWNLKEIDNLWIELEKWNQIHENEIGWALRRRSTHHHRRSRLASDRNLQRYSASKVFLGDKTKQKNTTHPALESQFLEMGAVGWTLWRKNTIKQTDQLAQDASQSVSVILEILFEHFEMSNILDDIESILEKNMNLSESVTVKKEGTLKNIESKKKEFLKQAIEGVDKISNRRLEAVYAYGDDVTGNGTPYSKLNIVFITRDDVVARAIEDGVAEIAEKSERYDVSVTAMSREHFQLSKNKKLRFLCEHSGVLMQGSNLTDAEEYPQIGLNLARLLNSDYEENMIHYQYILSRFAEKKPSQTSVNYISADIARTGLKALYSGVMVERAVYTNDLDQVYEILKSRHPSASNFLKLLYKLAIGKGYTSTEDLNELLSILADKEGIFYGIVEQVEQIYMDTNAK